MRQFQFEYSDKTSFKKELVKIRQWCKTHVVSDVLFTIFSETVEKERIQTVLDLIEKEMPGAKYFGCTTYGCIIDGMLCKTKIGVTCTLMEYPSTKLKLLQYKMNAENMDEVTSAVAKEIDENPWVSAVELVTTIYGMSMTGFCEGLSRIRSDVSVFGGGALDEGLDDVTACVFSKGYGIYQGGAAFLLIGGEDFHVTTTHIAGWKPLGRELKVTKAKGSVLYELDGKPAYDTYYKYLHIKNDENFFQNTLEFPFFYRHNGLDILRAPSACNEDGSLVMTADIEENVVTRMAYGDPWTILEIVKEGGAAIQAFYPEIITVFSCAARRTFWGDREVSKETMPFQSMVPTSGFYTSGEFLRTGRDVNQHNVTLVVAAMREGEIEERVTDSFQMGKESYTGTVSMINRLASFIEAATEELEEANRKLQEMAITDGLTKLYNRREIQNRINDATARFNGQAEEPLSAVSLIMLDIDNFKHINDTFGHKLGDDVLMGISDMLKSVIADNMPEAMAGRWGGEEFMVLLPEVSEQRAMELAEIMRKAFAEIDFEQAGKQTVSIGVTEARKGEDPDTISIRVDEALYMAKAAGKNRVSCK